MQPHHRRYFSQRKGRHVHERKTIIRAGFTEAPLEIDSSYFHFLSGRMDMQRNQ